MNDHPITPPPELVRKWNEDAASAPMANQRYIATQAARWGADQELEACCEWLEDADLDDSQKVSWVNLRSMRRPKPLSLKELALEVLDRSCFVNQEDATIIRHALEQLDD